VCCIVLRCAASTLSLHEKRLEDLMGEQVDILCSELQRSVAVCRSVLQCVAVCCSVLQCVAVCHINALVV